jgi:hypothetical protein
MNGIWSAVNTYVQLLPVDKVQSKLPLVKKNNKHNKHHEKHSWDEINDYFPNINIFCKYLHPLAAGPVCTIIFSIICKYSLADLEDFGKIFRSVPLPSTPQLPVGYLGLPSPSPPGTGGGGGGLVPGGLPSPQSRNKQCRPQEWAEFPLWPARG